MISPSEFHDLISGRRRGKRAALWRMGLRAAEVPYTWAVRYRNLRYDRGQAEIHRVDVPVVSVGNLTLGGTGKTPMIAWLARYYSTLGRKVGIVSRGYGATDGQPNDEARELAKFLPDVPHIQNRDRVAAARDLLAQHDVDLILLDDGFQHRRLHRDLDIVLIDAQQPTGFDHVFPRGCLREPMEGLERAGIAILTHADFVSAEQRQRIQDEMRRLAPNVVWAEAAHQPTGLADHQGNSEPIADHSGRRVFAFCGIGNPDGFLDSLYRSGCEVVGHRFFPDHHHYEPKDFAELTNAIESSGCELAACTQKDLVKISQDRMGNVPLRALQIEMAFMQGEPEVQKTLKSALKERQNSA